MADARQPGPLSIEAALAVAEKALRARLEDDDGNCDLHRWDDDDMDWPDRLRTIRETDDDMYNDATWQKNPHVEPYRQVWRAMAAQGVEPLA